MSITEQGIQSTVIFLIILCVCPVISTAQSYTDMEALFQSSSKLTIKGKSNVNEFACRSGNSFTGSPYRFAYSADSSETVFKNAELSLEIQKFDCGKKGINKDFRKTLKAESFPEIRLQLNHIYSVGDSVKASMDVELAGISRRYLVTLHIGTGTASKPGEIITARGSKVLKMSDFNLDPPSPMFGLIKLKDELEVFFDLSFRVPHQ